MVHVADVDNDTVDAISRLDLTDKADDLITWGEKTKRLEYDNVKMMNMCIFMLESNFKEDGFNSDVLMTLSDIEEDCLYALDLQLMRTAQMNNNSLMSMVQKKMQARCTVTPTTPTKLSTALSSSVRTMEY